MINTMSTTTTTTFARSNLSLAVTLFRLFVVFNIFIPVDLMEWLHSANIRSILIDPIYTIRHVEEAAAIRRLSLGRGSGDDAMIGTTGSISITNGKGTDTSHFVDSYRGHESGNSRVHLPPLVLASVEWLISLIPTTAHDNYQHWKQIAIALAILCVDVWIALSLERLAANILQREGPRELQLLQRMDPRIAPTMAHLFPVSEDTIKASQEPSGVLFQWRDVPLLVAHMYYCSPITMLAGSGAPMNGCFQNIRLAFLVSALAEASTVPSSSKTSNTKISSATVSAFALAVATYFDIHNILFLVPIVIWHGSTKAKTVCFLWDVFTFAFQALSVILVGEQSYFTVAGATHLYPYQYKGLAPSLSMLWYFGMESFIRFRPYFELLLGGLPFLVAIPLTIRLHRYPSVLVAIFCFLGVLFRPPGTLYTLNVGFCFILMNPRALSYMHQLSSVIALFALPIPVILYMVGYWMWLEPGNGEANYLYFQCLAYNIGLAILFLNFCSASLRRDKALRMTQAAERACNVAVEQNSKDIQIGRRLIPSAEVTVETKTT